MRFFSVAPKRRGLLFSYFTGPAQWEHIRCIPDIWQGPLVIEGLMHRDDDDEAARVTADGTIVANHGGRALNAAPTRLELLPAIRTAVGDQLELILDSGLRRGSDGMIVRCLRGRLTLSGGQSPQGI